MTYIEWRDELESYLTGLSDAEREKIFDYYSEMYADKRDLGQSERQIIIDFGAPYDVAQKILAGVGGETYETPAPVVTAEHSNTPEYAPTNAAKTPQKGGAKRVIKAILWALLGILLISGASSQLAEAIETVRNAVLCFTSGDGYTAMVAIGQFIMHVGIMVIIICLIVMTVKKLIAAIKAVKGE